MLDQPNYISTWRSNGHDILASTDENTYITSDEGLHWRCSFFSNSTTDPLYVYYGDTILGMNHENVIRSIDNGKTWETIPVNFPQTFDVKKLRLAGKKIYVFSQYDSDKFFYRSDDFGQTWILLATPDQTEAGDLAGTADRLVFLPSSSSIIYESTDFGATWTDISAGIPAGNLSMSKLWTSNQGDIFASSGHDLFRLDGNAWKSASNGLLGANNEIAITMDNFIGSGDTILLFGYGYPNTNKMYGSNNRGADWSDITGIVAGFQGTAISLLGNNRIYISGVDFQYHYHMYSTTFADLKLSQIRGIVFDDLNQNGTQDSGENGIPYSKLKTIYSGFLTTSDSLGKFSMLTDPYISDSLQAIPSNKYAFLTTPPAPVNSTTLFIRQGIHFQPNVTDVAIDMVALHPFVPGRNNTIVVTVRNIGTTDAGGTVRIQLPGLIDILSFNTPPALIQGDTISWSFLGLKRMESIQFTVDVYVTTDVLLGTLLLLKAEAITSAPDADISNNVISILKKAVASFDPNEKECEPETISSQMISDGGRLVYTIRFQNTGNYPATIIRVLDTLDNHALDPSTVEILAASHKYTWTLRKQNILEFVFDQILLPDSLHDEPNSHGFIRFSILPKISLQAGQTIQNRAAIYFDYNSPVETNSVQTKVINIILTSSPSAGSGFDFSLSPNPAGNHVVLGFDQTLSGTAGIWLTDMGGRVIWSDQLPNPGREMLLKCDHLPKGVYAVTVTWRGKSVTRNLVVGH
jgi:uncharacterized repeat protein (TIGR01451 family)